MIPQIPVDRSPDWYRKVANAINALINRSTATTIPGGSALTRTNDTNVTLTLGGTPGTALLQPTSLTMGWTGQLAVSRGGTGAGTLTGLVVGNGTSAFTTITPGTGVATALAVNVGSAGAFVTFNGDGGTPSSLTLTNATGLPLSTGVSGDLPFSNIAQIATDRLLGRDTAGTGDIEALTVGGGIEFTGSGGIQTSAFTGDVTKSAGGTATTIANDAVTYAKMQNVSATDKLLGRSTAGSGDVEEITCTAAGRALLDDADAAAQRTTLGVNFRGASVKKSGNQLGLDATAGSVIPWDSEEYNTDSIHDNVTNNSRLTVPSGVSKVRLGYTMFISNNTANTYIQVWLQKNGSLDFTPNPGQRIANNSTGAVVSGQSAVLPVSPGDYFEILLTSQSATSINILASRSGFAMEIVE